VWLARHLSVFCSALSVLFLNRSKEGAVMDRTGVLQEIRKMRFESLLDRHERGELSQGEAAELLGMSERTFRRYRDRVRDEGPEGLRDRRIGKPSSRRAAEAEILRMLGLYEEHYTGFTIKHFHEQLAKRHDYKLGYTVTRLSLQRAGLVRPAPKRSAHRKKRPRWPMVGMMLHQDASRFAWLPGDLRQYDLVVTLDDASGEVYSAFLVEEEGTSLAHAAAAFVAAERLLGMAPLWAMLDTLPMAESARVLLFERAALALRTQMGDLIRVSHEATPPTQLVAELGPGMARLAARVVCSTQIVAAID